MSLRKFLGATLVSILMLPFGLSAQEPVKTPQGLVRTPSVKRQKMAGKKSTNLLRHLTPAKSVKTNNLLHPFQKKGHAYMKHNTPKQFSLRRADVNLNFYGNLIYCKSWESVAGSLPVPFGIYSFATTDAGITYGDVAISDNFYATGGAYVKDGIYSFVNQYTYNGELYVTFYQYDMTTWQKITEEEYTEDEASVTLAYSPTEEQVYGIFWSEDDEAYVFDCIDFEDMNGYRYNQGSALPCKIMALACNNDGYMYGIGIDGNLYELDVDTGEAEEIGELGVTPDNYTQSAYFDPKTGILYWAAMLDDGTSGLYEVDTETGEATLVAEFEDGEEIAGMFIAPPAAEDGAPAVVTNVTTHFAEGATTGTVKFTAPSLTFDGEELTGTLNYSIKVNDNSPVTGDVEAGEDAEVEVTLDGGENTLTITVSNEVGKSPAFTTSLWGGADAPVAPANIKLTIDDTRKATLTWDAPAAGQHDGYVNAADLKYNVTRYPDKLLVAEGLTATAFSETLPASELTAYYYEVVAVNGTQTGKAGKSNSAVCGDGLHTPWTNDFTMPADFSLFTVIDANNDNCSWEYAYGKVRYYADENNDADDWLVSPAVHLQADREYKVGFTFYAHDDAKTEKIAIAFGQGSDPTQYDELLEPTEFNNTDDIDYAQTLSVSEAGDYRLAIHALSDAAQSFITVDDMFIVEGAVFAAPAAVSNLKVTPAALGALSATISFTAPTKTYKTNQTLTAITAIKVFRNGELVKEFTDCTPAANYSFTDEGMANGANTYRVVAYSEAGAGNEAVKAAWIGIDEPLEPQNIRLVDNGNDVTISWTAPGNEGIHGGYVIPENLKYNVYNAEGDLLIENLSALSYTDRKVKLTGTQKLLYYYVSATSEGGEGYYDVSSRMVAGDAYKLPFSCSFANGGMDNRLWWLEGNGRGSWVITYLDAQDGDGGSAFFAPDKAGDIGYLNSGRISLADTQNPGLIFYYKALPGKNVKLDVYAQEVTNDDQLLRTIDYTTLDGEEGWRREYIDLSSMKDARYILIKFRATCGDATTEVAIDNIQVRDILTHDLTVEMRQPAVLRLGSVNTIPVTVSNQGATVAGDYTVSLLANGAQVATAQPVQLGVGQSHTFQLEYTPEVSIDADVQLKATVAYADDENEANNTTGEVTVRIQKPDYPTVSGLTAENDHLAVELSWEAPVLPDPMVTDDFESYTPWIMDGIGSWTIYDGDNAPTLQFSDIWLPNAGKEMAFEVFNDTYDEIDAAKTRKFLLAHGGHQYLCTFNPSPSYQTAANDWLISPELSGEAQTITFFAKSVAANYRDDFEVLYSTTDNSPSSFKSLESFSQVLGGLQWTEYNIQLPAGAKYFAIRDFSHDCLGLMIDDVTYRKASLVVDSYNIYRDGELVGNTKDTHFSDLTSEAGTHVYQVSVVYTVGESLLSQEASVATLITNNHSPLTTITSQPGAIVIRGAQGKQISVYTLDGRRIDVQRSTSNVQRIRVSAGVYAVKVDNQTVTLTVK